MRLLRRRREPELRPCPRCSQLLESDALECPMCGLDLREAPEPAVADDGDRARTPAA